MKKQNKSFIDCDLPEIKGKVIKRFTPFNGYKTAEEIEKDFNDGYAYALGFTFKYFSKYEKVNERLRQKEIKAYENFKINSYTIEKESHWGKFIIKK